jgi:hypothetical protein
VIDYSWQHAISIPEEKISWGRLMAKFQWKLFIFASVVLTLVVLAGYLWKYQSGVRFSGLGWIPAMSFAEVRKSPSFVAVVESKRRGAWEPALDSSTGKPAVGAGPIEYVMVYLRRADGKRMSIYQENPTTDEVAFVASLVEGTRYSFPAALTSWGTNDSR